MTTDLWTPPAERHAGLKGKQPAIHVARLALARFRATTPTPPLSGDVSGAIQAWGMLANDRLGCCGVAMTEHGRMAKAVLPSTTPGVYTLEPNFVAPTDDETEALYWAYGIAQGEPGPEPDEGVANATWLAWLFAQTQAKLAGDDVQEFAYAEVDYTNAEAINQAMLDFHGVFCGVQLTDDAQQLFEQQQPWTTANGEQPDPSEGHDILKVKYDTEAGLDTYVTWGALQEATIEWSAACVDEAWVIVTEEDAVNAGVDYQALLAECKVLNNA